MNIETANRLLQYRKKHNLSQEALAEKIGVSRQAVSKWERAEASPDTDNLILLVEIYGVSLDELLKGSDAKKAADENVPQNDFEPQEDKEQKHDNSCSHNSNYEAETKRQKADNVSFKNGLHIDSKGGDQVHINWKDGIHVRDRYGAKVDVGWKGIHVEDGGKDHVYTDENGDVYSDEDIIKKYGTNNKKSFWHKFPFPLITLIAFIIWGTSSVAFGWSLSWIVFLTIPLYYTIVDAIYKRKASHFAYPVLVAIAYIIFGYFNVCGGWALGWLVFLTIPIYYWICSFFEAICEKYKRSECE